jgi:hypothetical protein
VFAFQHFPVLFALFPAILSKKGEKRPDREQRCRSKATFNQLKAENLRSKAAFTQLKGESFRSKAAFTQLKAEGFLSKVALRPD